ncbi:MAG: hypothetical protein MJ120_00280 [Clostridia bacterium]|nr:hypothetical protein [Clostridia bacterium]
MLSFLKKFISVITAFVVSVTTFPISFLPWKNDSEFEIKNCDTSYNSTTENDTIIFEINKDTSWFNYYGIRYASSGFVKGIICYENGFGKEKEEEFFLEPNENGEFYSFTDGVLNSKKYRGIDTIKIIPLDGNNCEFSLLGIETFNREIPKDEIYIQNEKYKIGVSLLWGGALSYMEDLDSPVEAVKKDGRIYVDTNASERYGKRAVNKHVNLINRHDAGRLIQQSYYGVRDSAVYENGYYTAVWRYNPVQGGNMFGDGSKLVDLHIDESSIYIKCRPMDWAKHAECIAPCYMEARYSFVENTVLTECRFMDFSNYEPTKTTQELPAFYCIEPLNNFVYYGGNEPWTGGKLTSVPDLPFWGGPNKKRFKATENWAAFTGEFEDSFGIGLYSKERNVYIPGVSDRGKTVEKDPSKDNPTSYFAIAESVLFESFKEFEYSFYLTTGNTDEIRENFSKIK